ncbi:hypothetical protein [Amycolatopsis sp. cmx-4-61]
MSPIDHLIVTVLGHRRAQAREQRPVPAPGRRPPDSPPERRSSTPGTP